MKIDFVPPPALPKLIPMLRHSGSDLAFEDIFSSKDIDGASTSEPLAGRPTTRTTIKMGAEMIAAVQKR